MVSKKEFGVGSWKTEDRSPTPDFGLPSSDFLFSKKSMDLPHSLYTLIHT
jgi:hypothetical protein